MAKTGTHNINISIQKSVSVKNLNKGLAAIKHNVPSMELLQSLPEKDKAVCLLHFHNNLSRSEIAKQLNISKGTVHNRLNHSLYLLKKQEASDPL